MKILKSTFQSQYESLRWNFPVSFANLLIFLYIFEPCSTTSLEPKGSFGSACDLSRPCDQAQNLACIKNVCECESPSNQRYDNTTGKCLSVVGGSCTIPNLQDSDTEGRKECIENANCVEVADERGNTFSECQCRETFIENSQGECVPGIGQPCSYLPHECNPLGMVVCKNGMCQCLDEMQLYDSDMKRCVSPAGTHCKYDDLQLGCVKNALCYPFFYWIPPKCLCKPGYVQTKSRQCVPENEYAKGAQQQNSLPRRSPLSTEIRPSSASGNINWPPQHPALGTAFLNHSANSIN